MSDRPPASVAPPHGSGSVSSPATGPLALTEQRPASVIPLPVPERITLPEVMPSIEALFRYAAEAELRVSGLRMVIEERRLSARGEEVLQHEIWLRHPGEARVTTRRDQASPSRDYEVWLLQGEMVTTYAAARRVASRRPRPTHVVGYDDADLPPFARQRGVLTPLPAGSLADTFVHPHGLFRNVLVTGPLSIVGARPVQGREAIVVRAAHPRTAKVLLDRPDRMVEVGIGRETGFVLLLSERIGDTVTRRAEVTELLVDPVIPSSAFELRLPADVRVLY